jgi:pimeloyl-ACP methyl ester carboxylesterase
MFRAFAAAMAVLTAAWSSCALAAPNPAAGHWAGWLERQGQRMSIQYDLAGDAAHASGRFTADRWRVMDYPLDHVELNGDRVAFHMGDNTFEGRRSGNAIAGTFKGGDGEGAFRLHRETKAPLPYREIPVTFHNGAVELHGTILMPLTSGRHPAVVLLHGSGFELRWGTNRYIGDRFARAGIAALIYDKRGSGESTGHWTDGGYDTLAGDALAAVDVLEKRADIDRRRIGLHGHSEGGMVAPLAATLAPGKIAFLVAEDTFAGIVMDQDIYRTDNEIRAENFSDADKAKEMAMFRLFVSVLSGERPYSDLEAASAPVKDQAWFKDLNLPPRTDPTWTWYPRRAHFDTRTVWTKIRQPTLLVFGEHDQLVPPDDSIRRIGALLDASGTPYTALIAPGAEHNLTIHPQPGETFFWWRQAPGIVDTDVAWVKACTERGPCVLPGAH